jgi:hypothetical protein
MFSCKNETHQKSAQLIVKKVAKDQIELNLCAAEHMVGDGFIKAHSHDK